MTVNHFSALLRSRRRRRRAGRHRGVLLACFVACSVTSGPALADEFDQLNRIELDNAPVSASPLRALPATEWSLRVPGPDARAAAAAALAGKWSTVIEALRQGRLHASAADEAGTPLLVLAARDGAAEVVRALLRGGANPEARGANGLSPLASAVLGGHADVARALVRAGADPLNPGGATQPPLHWAAQLNQLAVARSLVEAGVSPSTRNAGGQEPSMVALLSRAWETEEWLAAAATVERRQRQRTNGSPTPPLPSGPRTH